MRIKHLTLLDSGGAYLASRRISESQQSIGVDSEISCLKPPAQGLSGIERAAFKADRILTTKAKIKSDFSIFKSLPYGTKPLTGLNLINLHWLPGNLPFRIDPRSEIKFVVTLHDMNFFTGGCHHSFTCDKFSNICSRCPNVSGLLSQSLIYYSHKKKLDQTAGLSCAVAPSRWIQKQAENSRVFLNKEIIHIPNPVSPEFFRIQERQVQEPANPIKILILGSNYENKNSNKVLDIVKQLQERVTSNILLLVIGNKYAETTIAQKNLENSSSESDTAKFISESDFIIYASPAENFPSLLLEAQALGVPVIGLDRGGVRETFLDGQSGILVNSEMNEMFHASKSLIQNRAKLHSYSLASRRFAREYSYEVIAKRYLSLYTDVLKRNHDS